jgi:hypothetical protein
MLLEANMKKTWGEAIEKLQATIADGFSQYLLYARGP